MINKQIWRRLLERIMGYCNAEIKMFWMVIQSCLAKKIFVVLILFIHICTALHDLFCWESGIRNRG